MVRAGALRCALPLAMVREVMRRQPLARAENLAPGVLGVSVVRGEAVPVVSLGSLLEQPPEAESRFVVVRTPGKDCVLAVSAVESIVRIEPDRWQQMPKLLRRLSFAEEIAAADQDLIVTLDTARLIEHLSPTEMPQ